MFRIILTVALAVALANTGIARAETSPGGFGAAFNAASKRIGADVTISKVACSPSGECEYGAVPDLRILVRGDDPASRADSVSAYLPRDADKARSRRSAVTATLVAATLIAVFSPSVPPKARGTAVKALLDGATGGSHRGEIDLGGVNYVLSATQADNLRIYVER